jgi:hypothetical protein
LQCIQLLPDGARSADDAGDDFRLVPLRPVRCVLDEVQLGVGEERGEMSSHVGVEIPVPDTEDEADGYVESACHTTADPSVLEVESFGQVSCPGSDLGERVRLLGVTEELRKY